MLEHLYDVVVIGGGAAGCKAMETLQNHGSTNVLLVEAQSKLGGRIETVLLDGDIEMPVEMGANWLHGTVGNPLYELIQEYPDIFKNKKPKPFVEQKVHCYDQHGEGYSSQLNSQIDELYWSLIDDIRLGRIAAASLKDKSFEDFIFDSLLSGETEDPNLVEVKKAMIRKNMGLHCINAGCQRLNDCNLAEYGNYFEFDGGDQEFPGGYSKLIEFLVDKIPADQIKLNHDVKHIAKNGENLTVQCRNGVEFQAKHVIVTCSLGYLKKHYTTLFGEGLLDAKKQEAIQKLNIGFVNKLLFEYENLDFLPAEIDSIHMIYPSSAETTSDNLWLNRITKISRFFPKILRVMLYGNDARDIEQKTDNEICLQMTGHLRNVLKNDQIPLPSRLIRTNWVGNEYSLGSYTYIPHGATIEHMKQLAEPVCFGQKSKICFAGEAQHTKFYSTVLGAYLTGQQEAERILSHL